MSKFKLFFLLLLLGVSTWSLISFVTRNTPKVVESEKAITQDAAVQQSAEKFANEFKTLVVKQRWYRAKKLCVNPEDDMMGTYLESMKNFSQGNMKVQKVTNTKKTPNLYQLVLENENKQIAVMTCKANNGTNWKFYGFVYFPKVTQN